MNTPAAALKRILEAFDRLEIPYAIFGSVASSVYGIPRTTMDVDLVADLRADQIDPLAAELQADFYADLQMMKDAFEQVPGAKPATSGVACQPRKHPQFDQCRPATTRCFRLPPHGRPESILSKLRWYRVGGEISETQWNDLRGILMVSGATLDRDYLRLWAPRLGVADLLDRLFNA